MKFNPSKKALLTNEGALIKILHCPYDVRWDKLSREHSPNRYCVLCGKRIIDTGKLDESEIIEIVKDDPSACLKVSLSDSNIRVVNHVSK